MTTNVLPDQVVQGAIQHLNDDHQQHLLNYARTMGGAVWAKSAVVTGIDAAGFELLASDANGRQEPLRIQFSEPVTDPHNLRQAFINLADLADPPDGKLRLATAVVQTPNAHRYLKALCNHFDRKAEADYEGNRGRVRFPFGECAMQAEELVLLITVSAESDATFTRVKHIVADHLVRFGTKESLQVNWMDAEDADTE